MPLDPDKIRARREALGLSPADAAARASMQRPNWLRIESGTRTDPNLSTAERIAKALKCALSDLLAKHS